MPLEGRSLKPFEQLVYVELSTESVDPLYWWSYIYDMYQISTVATFSFQ